MCTDYDSYLKISPNQKKRGSYFWVRRALFALVTTTTSWDFSFYSEKVRLVSAHGHEHGARGVYEAQWWGLLLREGIRVRWLSRDNHRLRLQVPDSSFGHQCLCARRGFPLENKIINCIHVVYKFGNPNSHIHKFFELANFILNTILDTKYLSWYILVHTSILWEKQMLNV